MGAKYDESVSGMKLYEKALQHLPGYRDKSMGIKTLLSPLDKHKVLVPLALWMEQEVKVNGADTGSDGAEVTKRASRFHCFRTEMTAGGLIQSAFRPGQRSSRHFITAQ